MERSARAEGTAQTYPLQDAVDQVTRTFALGFLAFLPVPLLRWFQNGQPGLINITTFFTTLVLVVLWLEKRRIPPKMRALALAFVLPIPALSNTWFYSLAPGTFIWLIALLLCLNLFFGMRRALFLTMPPFLAILLLARLHQVGTLLTGPPPGIAPPSPGLQLFLSTYQLLIVMSVILTLIRIQFQAFSRISRHARSLFEGVHEAVFLADREGNVLEFNPSARDLFRLHDLAAPLNLSQLDCPPPEPSREAPQTHDGSVLCRMQTRSRDRSFWVEKVTRPIEIDERPCQLISLHEVDEIIQARESLSRMNLDLEDKVKERTSALARTNEELQATLLDLVRTQSRLAEQERVAALSRMVAGVAHELNTPLGNLLTCSELLRQDARRLSSEASDPAPPSLGRIETTAIIMEKSAQQAAQLIRQFKKVAVDTDRHALHRIRLADFLASQKLQLQHREIETGADIEIDCPDNAEIATHPSALAQILNLLTDNALLHGTTMGSAPRVIWSARLEPTGPVLEIRDHGPGISTELLPHLFDPFFTTVRNRGGIGLGAHIAWSLANSVLQGKLEARNADPGLALTLRLPQESPPAP